MSLNAAALRLMAEKGLSAHDIVEIAEAIEAAKPRSTGAERQARYRQNKKARDVTRDVTRDASPLRDHAPNERDNLTPTRVEKPSPKGEVKKFPAPAGVTDEQWAAFRKQRKKALNDHSYALLCKKLVKLAEDGWPPGEMIDLAIERGWETVFAPRNFGNERPGEDPTTAAVRRIIGSEFSAHA